MHEHLRKIIIISVNKQHVHTKTESTNLMRPTRGSFDTDLFSNKTQKHG